MDMQNTDFQQESHTDPLDSEEMLELLVAQELERRRKKRTKPQFPLRKYLPLFILSFLIPLLQCLFFSTSWFGGNLRFSIERFQRFWMEEFHVIPYLLSLIIPLLCISSVRSGSFGSAKAMAVATACVLVVQLAAAIIAAMSIPLFDLPIPDFISFIQDNFNGSKGLHAIYLALRYKWSTYKFLYIGLLDLGYIGKNILALFIFRKMAKH